MTVRWMCVRAVGWCGAPPQACTLSDVPASQRAALCASASASVALADGAPHRCLQSCTGRMLSERLPHVFLVRVCPSHV
jgi:hypothetical protein